MRDCGGAHRAAHGACRAGMQSCNHAAHKHMLALMNSYIRSLMNLPAGGALGRVRGGAHEAAQGVTIVQSFIFRFKDAGQHVKQKNKTENLT